MKKQLILSGVLALISFGANAQYYHQGRYYNQNNYAQPKYLQPQRYTAQPIYTETPQSEYYLRPYLGISYAYSMADFDDEITIFEDENYKIFDDHLQSLSFSAGLKFHPNFAIELSYQKSNKAKGSSNYSYIGTGVTDNANFKTEANLQTFAVDLVASTPISDSCMLLGSAGVGYYKLKYSGTYSDVYSSSSGTSYETDKASESDSKVGFRVGVGAEYFMTNNLALRGLARLNLINTKGSEIIDEYYGTKMDDWGKLNHTIDFNLGLFYYF